MLNECENRSFELDAPPPPRPPYEVIDPEIDILDAMSAKCTAVFAGPPDSMVIGRAWISDADGTMIDGETDPIPAGSTAELVLTIPAANVQNGDLIACMRVEWPVYQTKHVIRWTLLKGEIVHPPKGKAC